MFENNSYFFFIRENLFYVRRKFFQPHTTNPANKKIKLVVNSISSASTLSL